VNCTTSHLTAYAVFATPQSQAAPADSDGSGLSAGATAAVVVVVVVVVAAAVAVAIIVIRRRGSRHIAALDDAAGATLMAPCLEVPTFEKSRGDRMSTTSHQTGNPFAL
jgi:hypothetical protein